MMYGLDFSVSVAIALFLICDSSLHVPKPVVTLYYLKKVNVRLVALVCPFCI